MENIPGTDAFKGILVESRINDERYSNFFYILELEY